jgi:hypothetical protein
MLIDYAQIHSDANRVTRFGPHSAA